MFFILSKKNILFTTNCGEKLLIYTAGSSSACQTIIWKDLLAKLPEIPKDPNAQPQPTDDEPARINIGSYSSNYYIICDTKKNMLVLDRNFEICQRFVLRRVSTKAAFNADEKKIFVCDKTGDFYEFLFNPNNDNKNDIDTIYGKCLLGHCSMLLDFEVTKDFLITCDRDEKIRVTNYPKTYDIQTYCMGHKEFVTSVKLLDSERLLSISGDGRIILWNFQTGNMLAQYNLYSGDKNPDDLKMIESKSYEFALKSIEIDNPKNPQYFVVSFFKKPKIVIFKLEQNQILYVCDFKTDRIPIFVKFDPSHINYLWIVGGFLSDSSFINDSGDSTTDSSVKNIEIFELKNNSLQKAFQCDTVVGSLNSDTELTKNILLESQEDRIELLVKHSFNNVQDYHERKRLRIEKEKTTKQI